MKFYSKLLFLLLFFISSVSSFTQNNIVFSIDDDAYSLDQLQEIYKKDSQYLDEKSNFKDFVNSYIYTRLLEKKAIDCSIDTSFVYRRDLETLKQRLINQSMKPAIESDDFVELYSKLYKEEFEINQVFIPFKYPAVLPKDTVSYYKEALKVRADVVKSGFGKYNDQKIVNSFGVRVNAEIENGYVGWIRPFMLPYNLEQVIFSLKPNEISRPIRGEKGYHIFQLISRRPQQGIPIVEHVMFNFPVIPAPTSVRDSVYSVAKQTYDEIINKNNFDEICNQFKSVFNLETCLLGPVDFASTTLPSSLVKAAYQLDSINEVSYPIMSEYGYHIIRIVDRLPVPSDEEIKRIIRNQLATPLIKANVNKELIPQMMKKVGITLNNDAYKQLRKVTEQYSPIDSLFYASITNGGRILFEVDSLGSYTVNDFLAFAQLTKIFYLDPHKSGPEHTLKNYGEEYSTVLQFFLSTDVLDDMLRSYALILNKEQQKNVIVNSASFTQNIDLFEKELLVTTLLERSIWVKVRTDMSSLEKLFEESKDEFSFKQHPRFKGKIVYSNDENILNEIKEKYPNGEIPRLELKKMYRKDNKDLIQVEDGLWSKNDNPIIDEVIFKTTGERDFNLSYKSFTVIGRLLDTPEDFRDVLPELQKKYSKILEDELKNNLYSDYKVFVNKKVIDSIQ